MQVDETAFLVLRSSECKVITLVITLNCNYLRVAVFFIKTPQLRIAILRSDR